MPPEPGHAQPVHAVADQPEQGGQEGQGGDDGDDPDADRAHGEALHHVRGHQQHPAQRDHEHRPAEEDGAARGRAGYPDRVGLRPSAGTLLPVARDDEQRVVDPESEPHPRQHVHDEHGEAEGVCDERAQPQGHDDGDEGHQEWNEPGDDGAEDENEDDERRGQADLQLAGLEVVLGERVEVVVERAAAGHDDAETVTPVAALDEAE